MITATAIGTSSSESSTEGWLPAASPPNISNHRSTVEMKVLPMESLICFVILIKTAAQPAAYFREIFRTSVRTYIEREIE